MLACVVQIDGYDPVAAAAVTLYASSVDDASVCHLNGQTWWPALAKLPTLRYDFFDGAFGGQITAPSSSLSMQVEPWANFARYALADARFRLWTGNVGDAWGSYTLRFDGRVSAQPKIKDGQAQIDFAVDDRWLDTALLTTYAGTTGAEGPAALKGSPKPLSLGAPRYVPGVLIDSVNSVFQVSAYGSIQGFEYALERLLRFGSSIGDYASYSALVAASIPAGRWGTAKAVGMARFGAPPTGQVSFLVQGDNAGTDGWARKPGQLIRRLAILSGGTGKIDDTSLNALDTARPYNLSIYLDQQTTARDLIQKIAASVNAVAVMSWTGKLFVLPVGLSSPTLTLAADGSALPPVTSVEQIDIAAPFKKLAIGAERAWQVHSLDQIAFTATLIDLGAYASGTTYREGNIVQDQQTSWIYINPTATAGNAPPTLPTKSNSYWRSFGGTAADWDDIVGADKPADNADVTAAQVPSFMGIPSFAIAADYLGNVTTMVPFDRQFSAFQGTTDVTTSTNWVLSNKSPSGLAISVNNTTAKGLVTIGSGIVSGTATLTGTLPNGTTVVIPISVDKKNAGTPVSGGSGATSGTMTALASTSSASYAVASSEVVVRSDGSGNLRVTFDIVCSGATSPLSNRNAGVKLSYATSSGGSLTDIVAEQASGNYAPGNIDGQISYGETTVAMPAPNTDYYFKAQTRKVSGTGSVTFPSVTIGIRQ